MSLSVKFEKNWSHPEDPDGNNVRHYPKGIVVELPDDLAAAAIFEGAAAPARGEIPADVQQYIDAYASYVEQLENGATLEQAEANMAAVLAAAKGQEGDGEGDGGSPSNSTSTDDADRDGERTVEPIEQAAEVAEEAPQARPRRRPR